ncbi:uncharacterized protein LOC131930652 [Physella acuta]|uniref:uncharacterized protein LOC131930652 n=1 Tax=Physella acuta TaxID=109671 RepID=UPI0027DD9FA0|nr:uncharacterized protein LOC131930652 [Physella acuta]
MSAITVGILISAVLLFQNCYSDDQCVAYVDGEASVTPTDAVTQQQCYQDCVSTPRCYLFFWDGAACTVVSLTTPVDTSSDGYMSSVTYCTNTSGNCPAYIPSPNAADPIQTTHADCALRSVTQPYCAGYIFENGTCVLQFFNHDLTVDTTSNDGGVGSVLCDLNPPDTTTQPATTEQDTTNAASTTRTTRKHCKKG